MSTPGKRIKKLAAAAGLPTSPAELAKALGVTYETLRKWTQGTTAPNRNRAAKIAARLGCRPEAFMHGVTTRVVPVLDLSDAERAGVLAFRAGYPDLSPVALHAAQELAAMKDTGTRDALIAQISLALTLEQRAAVVLVDEPSTEPRRSPQKPRARSRV